MNHDLTSLARATPLEADDRVLYIEHDEHLRDSFVHALRTRGLDVDVAKNRREALSLVERNTYPVIVADLLLDDMDGVSLTDELRVTQPDASFIITTGFEIDVRATGGLEDSVACFLKKPWNDQQLNAALDTARESYRVRRASEVPHKNRNYSVLLLEDNSADAYLTTMQLQRAGCCQDVVHCQRLEQALAVLRRQQFDAILADLALPDTSGLSIIERLRAAAPESALIVLSGFDDELNHAQSLQLGAHDYLVKGRSEMELIGRSLPQAVERKRRERHVFFMAHHDALTQLINRDGFSQKLDAALRRTRRSGRHCAVMKLDLSNLKDVNEQHGEDAGDAVIAEIARRIQASVREEDTVARLDGDEFGVLLEDLEEPRVCEYVARRLIQITNLPVLLADEVETTIRVSVGIAVCPDVSDSADALMRAALCALEAAKTAGGGVFVQSVDPGRVAPRKAV